MKTTTGLLYLCSCVTLICGSARAADSPAAPTPAPSIAEQLGVRVEAQPIRERAGWHVPHLILVSPMLHEHLGELRAAAPQVEFVELSAASPAQISSADATIGICSAEVLTRAVHLQWIQWLGAGVENCVREPKLHERNPLLTNMASTAAPSMAEHVIALMLALSRHLEYFFKQQQAGHWDEDGPETHGSERQDSAYRRLGRHRHGGGQARPRHGHAHHRHACQRPHRPRLRQLRGPAGRTPEAHP